MKGKDWPTRLAWSVIHLGAVIRLRARRLHRGKWLAVLTRYCGIHFATVCHCWHALGGW